MRRRLPPPRSLLLALGAPLAAALAGCALLAVAGGSEPYLAACVLLVALALAGGLAAVLLPPVLGRLPLRDAIAAGAVVAPLGLAAAMAAGTIPMVLDSDQLLYLLVLIGVATTVALVIGRALTRPLAADLDRLRLLVDAIAAGDVTARSGVAARADELGRLARRLDELAERLETAERERVRMLQSVGHDLRTPLTAARAATEALLDGLSPDPDRYLRSVERQLDAMAGLIDDAFFLSRLERGEERLELETLDLSELVEEVVDAYRPAAERHEVHLAVSLDRPLQLAGGSAALGRLLRNLLDNAVRHAPPGSTVLVVGRHRHGAIGLEVLDEGDGFPAEFAPVATLDFTRADPARGSGGGRAGLGLAIARRVAEAHGGRVVVHPGPGGRVEIVFPGCEEAA